MSRRGAIDMKINEDRGFSRPFYGPHNPRVEDRKSFFAVRSVESASRVPPPPYKLEVEHYRISLQHKRVYPCRLDLDTQGESSFYSCPRNSGQLDPCPQWAQT